MPMRWVVISIVVIACAHRSHGAEESYPIRGLTPRQSIGGMVSIAGAPLPPLPKTSVRDAIVIYEGILAGVELFGESAALARGYGFLATLYASIGNRPKADGLFDDAETILKKHGSPARDLGWLHNNRGLVRLQQRRYADAVQSFRTAHAALAEHSDTLQERALVFQNLATVYHILGDVERSESSYLEALELLDPSDQHVDVVRANLAILYGSMRDFAEARAILEDLAARRRLNSSLRFAVLNNLGFVAYAMQDFARSEEILRKALASTQEGSEQRLLVLVNLSASYATSRDFEGAQETGEAALELAQTIHGERSSFAAAAMGTLGMIALTRDELEKADGLLNRAKAFLAREDRNDGALAGVIQGLAVVAQRRGQRDRAIALSREALTLEEANLERILAFGSEAQRLAYRSGAYPYDQLANLGDASLLAEAVLTTKGVVMDSLLAERALARKSRTSADRARLVRIQSLKVALMERTARGESDLAADERALKREQSALAKSLKRSARPPAARPTLAAVQAAIGCHQVLIEIIRFQRFEARGKLVPAYGGIIISQREPPAWVALDDAEVIDGAITSLIRSLDAGNRGMEPPVAAGDAVASLRALHDRLWNPLANAFPAGTTEVLLSPDGPTHFLPWAALLDENKEFVSEHWQIAEVATGRDVLRAATHPTAKTLLALADGTGDLRFSRREVERLATIADEHQWRTTILVGKHAQESKLFSHSSPRLLHLATHGDQLRATRASSIEARLSRNPMYQGVLLLAGSADALEAWRRNVVLPFGEDGILTAEEVAGLDLSNTWLTVLSACRSGAGDARIGEGVIGLRRGFALAGTEHLLFSLWSVDDEATAEFIQAFYKRLFESGDLAGAFHRTQVSELQRWKLLAGIPEAVFRAGAFVLTK